MISLVKLAHWQIGTFFRLAQEMKSFYRINALRSRCSLSYWFRLAQPMIALVKLAHWQIGRLAHSFA